LWNPRNSPISSRNCPHSQPLQLNSLPVDRFCFQANPVDWVPREFSRHSLGCSVSWRVGGLEGPVSTYLSIKHWILPHGGDRGPQNPMSDGEIRLQAVGGHWKAFKDLPSTLDFPVSHSSRASAPGKSGVEGRVLHPGWPTGQVFSLSFDGFSPTRHTFLWACRRPINDERKTSSWSSTLHALGLSLKTLPGALTRVSSNMTCQMPGLGCSPGSSLSVDCWSWMDPRVDLRERPRAGARPSTPWASVLRLFLAR